MRHRYLALALLGFAACGSSETPAIEQSGETGGTPASPSTPTTEAPAQLPIVETPPVAGNQPQPGGELAGSGEQPAPAGSPGTAAPEPSGGQTPTQPPPDPDPQQQPAAAEANDILTRAENALSQVRTIEADFVQDLTNLLGERRLSRGDFYTRFPDRFLMRFSDPAGDYLLGDGRDLYAYYPTNDSVTITKVPLAQGGQSFNLYREFIADATERYMATLDGTESVGGRQAHVLTLLPRDRGSPYRQIRIWVDTQDFLVRRFEITERNDSVRRVEMSNLRVNPSLSDDLFTFHQPPGTQIFEPQR